MTESQRSPLNPSMLRALCSTYADLLRRQRTATSAFAKWSRSTRRQHEFVWLGPALHDVPFLGRHDSLRVNPGDDLWESVHQWYGTASLNPYEREILFGYPYVIGRQGSETIRGPLLTIAIEIVPVENHLEIRLADEKVLFNSLVFRTEGDSDAHNAKLNRILEQTPELPLSSTSVKSFVDVVTRELSDVVIDARLDGTLGPAPIEPRREQALTVIDQAAIFVAPKTNYFLRSDLDEIAARDSDELGALGPLLLGGGDEAVVEFTNEQIDAARLTFPFPSNRAQRRVAMMLGDESVRVLSVQGPPGTGKSLTIANLACHLAAEGKKVLITSQKDKALDVVDAKLRELNLAEMPMTMLRRDSDSKNELMSRLSRVEKRRPASEVRSEYVQVEGQFTVDAEGFTVNAAAYARALVAEDQIEAADRALAGTTGLRRLRARTRATSTRRRHSRLAKETTDQIAERASERREEMLTHALRLLNVGLESGVAGANRAERQVVRELQSRLRRSQTSHKNFSMFDRMKKDLEQAARLLKILPVWILSPDDVARLFPCEAGLFDVVIIDEASQVDLPSMVPIAFRAKKLVVIGDTYQMQSQRFAFMSQSIALQAWQQYGMNAFDPDKSLHPVEASLLDLVSVRAEESVFLDEHFRCLPPIIEFSNDRWYDNQMRVMTDVRHKRFGSPDQSVIQLHHVPDGQISGGTRQENEVEATALVDVLDAMVSNPDYAGASIGVLCLFDEQVDLVKEMVAERIDSTKWDEHDLVVVNPDGFQGDERDVILYSLSYDDVVMSRAALSARQADSKQVQGMLNVAFTRARDEMHVFHSAPIDAFSMAGGREGAIAAWLEHCAHVEREGGQRASSRVGRTDSEFEVEVAEGLRSRGVAVTHQYPACGFSIDLMCELDDVRVAVECDGEIYHNDEQGNLRIEDLERQAILERADWVVLRIPYRKWRANREAQLQRVMEVLRAMREQDLEDSTEDVPATAAAPDQHGSVVVSVTAGAILSALRQGLRDEESVLRTARGELGYQRMGTRIRADLLHAVRELSEMGLVSVEDGEYFLSEKGRLAKFSLRKKPPAAPKPRRRRPPPRSRSNYRRRY